MKKLISLLIAFSIYHFTFNIDNCSAQWMQTNGPNGGDIQCLSISGANLFAGTNGGGIYLSTNNGSSWTAINNGLTNFYVHALAVSGTNIFAGTQGVIFLSTDNGSNWTAVNNGLGYRIFEAFAVSGTNLFAGTNGGGMFLSTNNGSNWTAINSGLSNLYIWSLAVSGTNLFAGTSGGVFLSTNNGSNWTAVNSGLSNLFVVALAVSGTNIFTGISGGGVFLSTNNGANWIAVNSGLANLYVTALAVSGTNLFAGISGGLFLSTNNGTSWNAVNNGLTSQVVSLLAVSGINLFAGTDIGVFLSANNGGNWTSVNNGLTNLSVQVFAVSETNIFAGTQRAGLFLSTNYGANWTPVNNGLTGQNVYALAVSPGFNGTNIFAGTQIAGIFLSTNNGANWTAVNNGLTYLSTRSLVISGTNLFAGTDGGGVFLSTNNGVSWSAVNYGLTSQSVSSLAVSGTNLFAGTWHGVFLSTNNGSTWIEVNNGLTNLSVNGLAVSGTYLFTGTNEGGVFLSSNNGANWTAVNNGLTSLQVRSLAVSGTNLFAGTYSGGIFISTNNGANWLNKNQGFNSIPIVNSLFITNNYVFAGTIGYSAWRRLLSDIIPPDTTTRWLMQVKSQISTVYDNENFAGVADSATEGFDSRFDLPEPPPSPGNYISAYFSHPEWGVITGSDFARDIKKYTNVTDTVKRWFFFVKTNVLNDTVKLTFLKDRIPTSLGKYLTDLSTGQRINLKNISEYKYYNTSATARQFELIIGDSTAPALTMLYPLGSNIFRSGTTKNINWTTSDGTGIDSIFIYKSTDAGTNYSLLKGLGFSQTTTWTIPNEYLNNNYSIKIIARDSLGNTNTAKSVNTFTVVGDSLSSTAIAGWNLLSLPFIPNDSTTSAIFGDDFGSNPYYVWGYGYSTGYYTASYLLQGKGYWLGSLSSTVWDLRGTALESDSSVQDLEPGFNLIGNNYVRGISKNTLQFIKSGVQYSFTGAVSNGLISSVIYKFNGTGYITSDTLSLFDGYWLPVLQTGVKMVQKPLPSTVTPLTPLLASPTPDNWELSVNASTSTQSDEISMIGVKPDATPEYDPQYDFPRPPRAPGNNYLELYFEHSGGNWPLFLGNKYAGDFISPSNPNWTFKVDCSQSNTALNIKWNKQYLISLGNNVSLSLTDNANNQSVNMKSDSIYTFTYTGIRTFTISSMITGISSTPEIPTEFAMNQNYPNPFNPVTTIKYQLPKAELVTIKIYDIIGKEITTLINRAQNAGYYEVNFNAGKLSSGIYFYKMVAGDFVSIKKLVVLK